MTIEQLNQKYGAPGRIVFRAGFAGYPNVVLANQYGTAVISLLGANVLSYRPTGHAELIFRPARTDTDYNRGDAFHGGIPVCWPQFGNRFSKEMPMHGYAAKLVFEVRATEYSEEKTEITLGLSSDAETRKLWPHEFDLEYKVSVTMKLNLALKTTNTGAEAFDFSCGFHPYFLTRDRNRLTVRGLAGATYIDAAANPPVSGTWQGDLAVTGPYDHVFTLPPAPKHAFALLDAGLTRAIALASTGNDNLVVWNPDTLYVCSDMSPDDWRRFTCVEPVSDWPGGRTLAPGESYVLAAAIQAHLEGEETLS